uniref:Secreted protein n=1 Tax=Arundo donax TaxID=35708 RepID=A0A0A9G1E0_ARUDO
MMVRVCTCAGMHCWVVVVPAWDPKDWFSEPRDQVSVHPNHGAEMGRPGQLIRYLLILSGTSGRLNSCDRVLWHKRGFCSVDSLLAMKP